MVVEEYKPSNTNLTVKSIQHASVAGYNVAKICYLECTFEATGEEPPKGTHKGHKKAEDDDVVQVVGTPCDLLHW